MSATPLMRNRIMSICGPAFGILLVYHIAFYRPLQVALRAERAKLSKIEASLARKATLEQNQAKLADAQLKIESLNQKLAEAAQTGTHLVARRDDLRNEFLRSRSPAMAMAETLALLSRYHLECLDSGPVVADNSDAVSESLQPVADLLGGSDTKKEFAGRREIKIKLRGRFQDVQSALSEMQVAPLGIFTVSLEMEVSDAYSDQRIWILTIAV